MQGKTVVITGTTSGVGEAAAVTLAKQGARIITIARDQARLDAAMAKIRAAGPNAEHKGHLADFSSIADMKRVGAVIAAETSKIDVLANNAGAMLSKRVTTVDGLELTFAVNHMAYFVLTNALLENIKRTPGARIVNTASSAHSFVKVMDFDDLNSERHGVMQAYGLSKLCNMLHALELSKRLAGTGAVANSFHPGFVASRFGSGNGLVSAGIDLFKNFGAISADEGAGTLLWLATSDAAARETGGYFIRCKRTAASTAAYNDVNAARLWEISTALEQRAA